MTTNEEELILLSNVYESARAVMRYRGVDAERTEEAYRQLYLSVHSVNDFYLDPDNETET